MSSARMPMRAMSSLAMSRCRCRRNTTRTIGPADWFRRRPDGAQALRARQPRREDPHELRRRRRPHLGPRVRQVVLHGRVRQAEAVGGGLLRAGGEDRGDDHELAVRRAPSRSAVLSRQPPRRGQPLIAALDRDRVGCSRAQHLSGARSRPVRTARRQRVAARCGQLARRAEEPDLQREKVRCVIPLGATSDVTL